MHSNSFSRVHNLFRIDGCLVVSSEGRSGGLTMLWRERVDVAMQNYFNHHINSLNRSLDILRRVGVSVREEWVVGGDFNAIISDVEKERRRRKSRATMEEFRKVMEKLSFADIKTDNGWFT
ncbi:hypothetical protein J1N35_022812 [Gossypium stocksii]|uniref:Endonuclease/exonuclease/phosphatase domain-containing protein n=1 Tax=Gossypium stocksii TaxID=47602 RepID=A0A9D3VHF7_9ROSI|nr:hypothetical protein J1N35_022812 [Gossypium stocksii]